MFDKQKRRLNSSANFRKPKEVLYIPSPGTPTRLLRPIRGGRADILAAPTHASSNTPIRSEVVLVLHGDGPHGRSRGQRHVLPKLTQINQRAEQQIKGDS